MTQGIVTLPMAVELIGYLQNHHVDPILYGSLGVSLYLGKFKQSATLICSCLSIGSKQTGVIYTRS
jgi:hypothetical protein